MTATGDKNVISRAAIERMKDGAILANTGHFNVEIDIPGLRELAQDSRPARPNVEEFSLPDGRRLYLVAEGRLVNLSAAEGHPAAVMDMSFANQALSAEYLVGESERSQAACVRRSRGDRPRDRAPEARDDGHRDRPAHRGAGEVPGFLGRGGDVGGRSRKTSSGSRATASSSSTSAAFRGGGGARLPLLRRRGRGDPHARGARRTRHRCRRRVWVRARRRARRGSRRGGGHARRGAADGGQPGLGARGDAPTRGRPGRPRARAPSRGGRPLPSDGRARGRLSSSRARAHSHTATPAGSPPAVSAPRSARSAPPLRRVS